MTTQRNEELAFAVLADQVRRQILDTLATHGECNAGFISDQISTVGRTTVSTHLKALRLSGVIVERRQGRHRLFSIDPSACQRCTPVPARRPRASAGSRFERLRVAGHCD
uniref:Nitrile hydratase regulator 2 n=1 Tax=Rhodococcus erythropolis TaxID=1833 RepID=B1GXZ9_RHOER|nr:nitrile hydratase regulator 2 [Rhodococcus erythropolis]